MRTCPPPNTRLRVARAYHLRAGDPRLWRRFHITFSVRRLVYLLLQANHGVSIEEAQWQRLMAKMRNSEESEKRDRKWREISKMTWRHQHMAYQRYDVVPKAKAAARHRKRRKRKGVGSLAWQVNGAIAKISYN